MKAAYVTFKPTHGLQKRVCDLQKLSALYNIFVSCHLACSKMCVKVLSNRCVIKHNKVMIIPAERFGFVGLDPNLLIDDMDMKKNCCKLSSMDESGK